MPGVEFAQGDLEQPASLAAAVRDIDAIVFTHGGPGSPDGAHRIDYGRVASVLHPSLDDEPSSLSCQRTVRDLLDTQRVELVRLRDTGEISDEVMHALMRELDLEDQRVEI